MINQRDKFKIKLEQRWPLKSPKEKKPNKKRILHWGMMHQIQMIVSPNRIKAREAALKGQVMRSHQIPRVHLENNRMEINSKTNNQLTKINNNSLNNNSSKGVKLLLKVEEFKMKKNNSLSFWLNSSERILKSSTK